MNDQKTIDHLKSENPAITDADAREALRLQWIERVAGSYQSGVQPGFGGGFTPQDDAWLDQITQAIKNKTSPRPPHPDPTIENALATAGL